MFSLGRKKIQQKPGPQRGSWHEACLERIAIAYGVDRALYNFHADQQAVIPNAIDHIKAVERA